MKSKSTLTLIEQLIMLLFFALAAAVCLRLFAHAGEVSESNVKKTEAITLAEDYAETLSNGGTFFAAEQIIAAEDGLTVVLTPVEEQNEWLGGAEITVYDGDECLITLPARWQR